MFKKSVIYLVSIVCIVSSCKKRDVVRNGSVEIDIKSHQNDQKVSGVDQVLIEVDFTTKLDEPLSNIGVQLFQVEEPKTENDVYTLIGNPVFESNILGVWETSYDFSKEVDLSDYDDGSLFLLRGYAEEASKFSDGGIEIENVVFEIVNPS